MNQPDTSPDIPSTPKNVCPNCGAVVHGRYCHNCGQKHRTPHDYQLAQFFKHAFHEFTDLDSKVLRSIRYLLFAPGKLTAEWIAGREHSYVMPMRLFLFVNILYFIFLQFFPVNTIVVPLESQYSLQMYSRTIRPIVDARVKASHVSFKKYSEVYDELSATQAKTLVILMVPMLALLLALIYVRKHLYFVQHLVFCLHFYSFFLILISFGAYIMNALVLLIFKLLGQDINAFQVNWDVIITLSDGTIILFYLISALKKAYGGEWWANTIRAGLLTYSLIYILFLYRFVLFFTAIYSMPAKL